MVFAKEADFEAALINILTERGWEKEMLHHYTEKQLIANWAAMLFDNNRGIDQLNDYPLTDGEMHVTEANINEFGRFDALKATVAKSRAKAYFEKMEGMKLIPPKVAIKTDRLLRDFILKGGFDVEE